MISFDEALRIVLEGIDLPQREKVTVGLSRAAWMILAESVMAPFDLPPFDRSTVDGYGFRAGDAGENLEVVGDETDGADHHA